LTAICKYKLLSPKSAGESEDLVYEKSVEEGQRRIQALLADWLRMENVVVLTAAGCSVGAGGRLMTGPASDNLECLVLNAVEKCPLSADARALISWKMKSDFGKGNFEDWLSYLFNASGITKPAHSPIKAVTWKGEVAATGGGTKEPELSGADEEALRGYIERAIFAECALELDRKEVTGGTESVSSGHIPFLAKLIARDTNLGRTHLFTLNYDTLFEQAMEELGI
jgi:hypothetical protein